MKDHVMQKTGVAALKEAIPDELQHEVIAIGVRSSSDKFKIGDITNMIKALVQEYAVDASVRDVYKFMALLTNEEISARLVEYYAGIAYFCDYNMRAKYDVLTFSHFAKARSYGHEAEQVLEFMMAYYSEFGRAPSVAWVEMKYTSAVMAEMKNVNNCGGCNDTAHMPVEYEDARIVRGAMLHGAIQETRNALERLLDQTDIGSRLQKLALELLYELEQLDHQRL